MPFNVRAAAGHYGVYGSVEGFDLHLVFTKQVR